MVYGMIAVLVERGVRMVFWALEERKKMIASRKAEGRAELIAEMLADANAEGDEEYAMRLEREAIDRGIPLDKPPRK